MMAGKQTRICGYADKWQLDIQIPDPKVDVDEEEDMMEELRAGEGDVPRVVVG